MIDVDNLPDYVLNSILKNLGWEPGVNDDQLGKLTARVSKMSVEEAFGCYCVWNGLLGSWGTTLLETIDALRSCDTESGTTENDTKPTDWRYVDQGTPVLFRRTKESDYEQNVWFGGYSYFGPKPASFCWSVGSVAQGFEFTAGAAITEKGEWHIDPFWCKLKTEQGN
jgi:hypothetical protein